MHEIIIDEIKTLFSSEFKNIKIGIKKYATRADNELILNNFVIKSQSQDSIFQLINQSKVLYQNPLQHLCHL